MRHTALAARLTPARIANRFQSRTLTSLSVSPTSAVGGMSATGIVALSATCSGVVPS